MPGIYDFTDTWNDAGTVFNAIKCDVTDTASHADSALIKLSVNGVEKHFAGKDGKLRIGGNVSLHGDAANTLAQRNGVNPQAFYLYNTYTDNSNYERGGIWWSGNILYIGSFSSGTGSVRSVRLVRNDSIMIELESAIHISNNVFPTANNSFACGWSSLRWSVIYTQNLDSAGTIKFSALPTTDPTVPGQLYRDASGFVKVSL
ncbi:MAG: hypothetical protein KatS3mg087_1383 [Patescibacteria group bacterium]|nr:MAG: hypothetical protein KatS3mg087_1383 [Patescibacteria group bacterium]